MQQMTPPATPARNKNVARNIMTGGAAATRLGISRSTLTRYLRTYPELNRSSDPKKILVDIDELRTHRLENVNLVKSGNHAGVLFDENADDDADDDLNDEPELPARPTGPAHAVRDETPTGGYASARARREEAMARKAEREEALALEQLVIKEDVDAALGDALVSLRDKLLSPDLDLCEMLARVDDPTKILGLLRKANRAALEKLAEAFADADTGGTGGALPGAE